MASISKINKSNRYKQKNHPTRGINRCKLCGRSRGYLRFFSICRLCFRELASQGKIPGVKKASW